MNTSLPKVSIGDIRRRSIFLGTPMYGGMATSGYTSSVVGLALLCKEYGIGFHFDNLSNESLIQRARNYIVDDFMRSGMTHLLFIDADIEFDPRDVMTMLALADYHGEYDIICGPYPKKAIAWEKVQLAVEKKMHSKPEELENYIGDFVFNLLPADNKDGTVTINLGQPVQVREGGTGFMLIQRRVFESFADAYPDSYYRPDHKRSKYFDGSRKIVAYFDCVIDRDVTEQEIWDMIRKVAKGEKVTSQAQSMISRQKNSSLRYWSEDYYFCQMVRKLGMKVWLCPWIKTKHYGTYPFGGSLESVLRIGAHPTIDQKKATDAGSN